MKLSEEYKITLVDDLSEYQVDFDSMFQEASEHGITYFNVSKNGRVISVETSTECNGIRDIISWLASTLPFVELIGQIIQVDTYEPRWTTDDNEDNVFHVRFD